MKSIIIGAGTYGEVYLAYLKETGVNIVGFLDDNPILKDRKIRGIPILGNIGILDSLNISHGIEAIYCPLGNNKLRTQILSKAIELGYKTPNYIHPSVNISPGIIIGKGVYILLGTHIMPYTIIEDFVMISMGVNVAHHSILREGTFLSTGVNFGASIIANKYAYVGIGSTITTGMHELGENCLVGAGAVIIEDVPKNAVMAGVPAKLLRYRE